MRQSTKDILLKTEQHLESLSDQLIGELTKILEGDWGLSKSASIDNVSYIDIQVFTDGYRLALYPMDASSSQLGHKSLLKEEYADGLLTDEALNPDLDLYDFSNTEDNQELDEFDIAQKELFIKWFLECWNKTDNSNWIKPIYLSFHDMEKALDLRTNQWVDKG
jgi:hypothetical protein